MIFELTQKHAAKLIDRTPRFLREEDAPRDPDTKKYNGPELVSWHLERELSKVVAANPVERSSELTRLRAAQASLAELKLAEHRRELIPVEDVRDTFDSLCNVWARASRQLQKSGHEDAWEIVKAHLSEARDTFDRSIKSI